MLGAVYAATMPVALVDSWNFYIFFGVIDLPLSLSIIWQTWRMRRWEAL